MINEKNLTTFHRGVYTSPSVAVTCLESQGMILEGSEGSTQNYNPIPIWEIVDND